MKFKQVIIEQLKQNRPNLSVSSLNTYASSLANLPKKINASETIESFNIDKQLYINYINSIDLNSQTPKSLYSALYIITMDEDYRNAMITSAKIINDNYTMQIKTEKQIENTISIDEIKNKVDYLKKMLKLDPSIINYQNYFLLALMSGQIDGIEPRRNEWGSVKVSKNIDTEIDNYLKKNNVVFNTYKTAKSKGKQIVHLPKSFMILLNRYMKISKSDYLFYNDKSEGLSSSAVCKRLNKIFDGKNISCDILRSTYLTDLYKDMPSLIDMQQIAEQMGHTVSTALHCYVKK